MKNIKIISFNYPILTALVLSGLCFGIRLLDVFLIRSDEIFGEQIVTKVFGLILIVVYVLSTKGNLSSIGLTSKNWKSSFILGISIMAFGLTIGYLVEWIYLSSVDANPSISFAVLAQSLVPEKVKTGGLFLTFTIIGGNVINSFMEEGLFRGILITHLSSKLSVVRTNIFQSLIFGFWHIVWPLRDYLDGYTDLTTATITAVSYIAFATVIGFSYGYLFYKTNSLWTSWSAHTLNNTAFNFIHITTNTGLDVGMGLRVGVAVFTVAASLPFVKMLTKRYSLLTSEKWVSKYKI